jgi:hypothetical protein
MPGGYAGTACRTAWAAVVVALLATGCASPAQRADDFAQSAGFERDVVQGTGFRHVVYRNSNRDPRRALHVYIEGDGRPYLDRWTVAPDPTPVNPLMLQLMAADGSPALYLGRPCYFGLATDAPCTPLDWTLRRFSKDVVDSMAAVIVDAARDADTVELFGHSGGGALAVLLARRLDKVTRVVTLAGNLDPAAWAALHHYTPLTGSLDPLADGLLRQDIGQFHYAGGRDRNMPPGVLVPAVARLGSSRLQVVDSADHTCCWKDVWPAVLASQTSPAP